MNNIIKKAKQYLQEGYSIIPVGRNKKPLIEWKIFQTKQPTKDEVERWFERYQDCNIAIVTGRVSGIAVVDVERGGSVEGLPITRIVKTGGGGWHYYYKYQEGIENKARIRELMDIRGEGGYVIAPSSVHESGEMYEWVNEDEEIVDFPDDLLGQVKTEKTDWGIDFQGACEGNRNTTASRVFGKLLSAFNSEDWNVVWELACAWNQKNNPPMPESELRSVFESIAKKEQSSKTTERALEKHFEILDMKTILNKDFPKNRWVVDKLIPLQGITILSGAPASYKTWLLLQMAINISTGTSFLDQFETDKNNILIVDEENHLQEIKRRSRLLGAIDDLPIYFASQNNFNIEKTNQVDSILEFCKKHDIDIIFFDSLVRINNADENSASDMSRVFNLIKKLCQKGKTIILTHHERKEGNFKSSAQSRLRGSSDILAAVDAHLAMKKNKYNNEVIVDQVKLRCAEEMKPFQLEIKSEENKFEFKYVGTYSGDKNKMEMAKELIPSLLENEVEGLSRKEIIEKIKEEGIGEKNIRAALEEMIKSEEIIEEKGERNTKICFLNIENLKQQKSTLL